MSVKMGSSEARKIDSESHLNEEQKKVGTNLVKILGLLFTKLHFLCKLQTGPIS